jgi:hypothetical protein
MQTIGPSLAPEKNPISVGGIFLLVTASGILAACARYINLSPDQPLSHESLLSVILGAAVIGAMIGIVFSIFNPHYRWASILIGVVLGAVVGPLLLIGAEHHFEVSLIAYTGSYILIVLMLLVSRRPLSVRALSDFRDGEFDS